jgi:hypothetical protein
MNRTEFRIGQKKKKLQIGKLWLVSLVKEKRRKILKEKTKSFGSCISLFLVFIIFLA